MSIDLDDIERRIADGIYGDDRLSKKERNDAFSALAEIIAEVERLRTHRELCTANLLKGYETGKAEERDAVVAWLHDVAERIRRGEYHPSNRENALLDVSDAIERGEHRREEER